MMMVRTLPPPNPTRLRRRPAARSAAVAFAAAVALALTALTAGCGGEPPASESSPPEPAAAPAARAEPPAQQRAATPPPAAPLAPLTSSGEPAASGPMAPPLAGPGAGATSGRLVWALPAGWTEVPPASSMRLAQASIPGPGGPADLVLFHFGVGGGGGVQANIERWIGQMEVDGEPESGRFEGDGLRVTWVDVAGTLKPSGMGVGPTEPQPGSRLLGAVVEGAGGPWFFKATGPAETLAAARDDFLGMLRAARVE